MLSLNLSVGGLGTVFLTAQVASAAPVAFFTEPFPNNNGNTVTDWIETETSADYAKLSKDEPFHSSPADAKGHARLTKNASIEKTISTVGYSSIKLKYYWRGDSDAENTGSNADYLKVYWKPVASSSFAQIRSYPLNDVTWDSDEITLPSTAADTSIIIKFQASTTADDEQARIDDIQLTGERITYALTVNKLGNGTGSVTSSPAGISCGVDCAASYDSGTPITLTAVPTAGSTFTGWSGGGCSGTGTCTTTITAATTVTATFTLMTHTLSVHTTGGGAVTSVPAGISCGMGGTMCGASYDYGTAVTLTPIPDTLSTFTGWGGDCTGTGSCVVTMDDVRDVSASFTTIPLSCPSGTTGVYPDCVTPPLACDAIISSMTRVSNGTDVHVGSPTGPTAVPLTFIHSAWTASIPGATWIWSEEPISAPTTEQDSSFFDVFTITGTPTAGTLDIAADNTYEVYLNSVKIGESVGGLSGTDDNNFQSGTQDVIPTAIIAPNLVSGQNTLEFRVRNKAGSADWHGNPAGLLYKLSITKNACEPVVAPVCNPDVNLFENAGFEAPTVSSWSIIPFTDAALKWLGAWVTPHTDGAPFGLELQKSVAGSPAEGLQLAELDGYHPTTIWQNVPTIPGYDYALSFKYSPRPGTILGNNVLEVRKDGTPLGAQISRGSTQGNTEWSTETRSFTAAAATTKVEFADVSALDDSLGTYLDDMHLSCVGPHVPKTTIVATKVVCDSETDLPNWSYTDHTITANTAADYVAASGGHCRLAPDWKFQWAPTTSNDPGDAFTGEAPLVDGWHTFGPTDGSGVASAVIEMGSMTSVWMREVLKPGYIPFTFHTTNASTSAEMYCSGDVKNYDNLDYAQLADGSTQYCVAFNAPVPPPVVTPPHCDLQGYKYMGEGEAKHGVPNVVVGVMDMPSQGQGEDCDDHECDHPQMHLTKTDESGHYCFVDLPRGPHHLFEIAPVDTELVQLSLNGSPTPYPARIGSFFDIFTELHMTPPSPATMDSFFDVFVELPDVAPHRDSFFDVFTELELTPPASIDSFFDVFVDVDFQDDHIDLYNRAVVTPPTNNGGGGGSTPPQCADGSDNDNDGVADLNDGGCANSLDNDESGSGAPPENGGGDTGTTTGEVLGAATTTEIQLPLPASCAANPYLRDYLKMGKKNDPEQVKLLQIFLNENMSAGLPVTGYFGPLTKMWVKKFQKANHAAILQPWIDAGFDVAALRDGTGNVFKTTKYYINKLKCAESIETMPPLTLD